MRASNVSRMLIDSLDAIDSLQKLPQHILLGYEDASHGRLLEFRYIKNGLISGENCIYITRSKIETVAYQMERCCIDVREFNEKGSLSIIQFPKEDALNSPRNLRAALRRISKTILSTGIQPPFRIVSEPWVFDVPERESRLPLHMEVERIVHAAYRDEPEGSILKWLKDGSLICSFLMKDISSQMQTPWGTHQLRNHHVAILAER
jgi:hypothetical protein